MANPTTKKFNGTFYPVLSNGNLHVKDQSRWYRLYDYMVKHNLFRMAFSREPERGDTFGGFHYAELRSFTSYFQRFCRPGLMNGSAIPAERMVTYNVAWNANDPQAQGFNAQYWALRHEGQDSGQGNAFIGSEVRKPNGQRSKLFSATAEDTSKRFDVWTVKTPSGPEVTFQLFTDEQYKKLRDALVTYTNLWNKNLGEGRRFREGQWTEAEPFSPPATVDQSTAESREEKARADAEEKLRPEIDDIQRRQLKQINVPNVLISQTPAIAQATGITTGKKKLNNVCLYKGSPESLVGILGSQGKDILPFVEATPDQLGALAPHIELFFSQRNADGSETDEPVFFSDHVNPEHLLQVANARRTDDLSKLTSTKGSNVGIQSFEWTYDNKHFGDNVLIANLSIYFASMADLVQPQWHELLNLTGDILTRNTTSPKKNSTAQLSNVENDAREIERLSYKVKRRKKIMSQAKSKFSQDTMNLESKRKGQKSKAGVGKEYRDLKIIIGWSTPEKTYGRADAKFIKAVGSTRKLIKLNLMKFTLDFGQQGQAVLNMEFAGSIGNFLSDEDKCDVLGLTAIEEHFDVLPVDVPVVLPGDRLLGLPETTLPKGYLATMSRLNPRVNLDYYKKLGTAGSLGQLMGQTVSLNRAGIQYELETLRVEKLLLQKKNPKKPGVAASKSVSKRLQELNTYIKTANAVLESIDDLYRKAKYASFLQRMLEAKKIYYSTIKVAQTRQGPTLQFFPRGVPPLESGTPTASENLQKAWTNEMDRAQQPGYPGASERPPRPQQVEQDLRGGFIDPDAGLVSGLSIEEPGQITAYYLKLGDIIDTAFATASQRKDCGIILGSFSPFDMGIGNDTTPRYYSLADIPISLEAYGDWFNTHITNRGLTRMPFRRFVVSLLDDLVGPLMNNMLSTSAKRVSMKFDITIAQSEGTLKKGTLYTEGQMRTRLAGITPSINNKINQYLVITCNQTAGGLRGNVEEDAKRGIQHLVVGADRGLVKTFSFSEKQVPHLRAMNIANAQWENALVLPQDAELTMVGNNLFQNGQMVYINADLGLGTTVARKLGLGGYYRVVRSAHSIAPGKYETVLTCHWEMRPE